MLLLKELRKERNLYQKDLAKILNKSTTCICEWENGNNEPNIEDLIKLADFFACTTDELLGRVVADAAPNTGVKITPLARRLLDAFDKLNDDDQRKLVGIAEAIAVMS